MSLVDQATKSAVGDADYSLSRHFSLMRVKQQGIRLLLLLCALMSIATTVGIVFVVLSESIFALPPERAFLPEVALTEFLTETRWTPQYAEKHFGVLPLLAGTLQIAGIAALVALPIEPDMHMFSASRRLERVADHATNMAEDVVYLVEGEIIRHRKLDQFSQTESTV